MLFTFVKFIKVANPKIHILNSMNVRCIAIYKFTIIVIQLNVFKTNLYSGLGGKCCHSEFKLIYLF